MNTDGCAIDVGMVSLDSNHVNTLQELLNAVSDLPGVWDRVDAYMRGRGIEDPQAEMGSLRNSVF